MQPIVTQLCLMLILFVYRCSASNVSDQYYPRYHLAPPHGWMNDPNGFSVYKNKYHLFYQYNPESSQEPGTAHWGHAQSDDLFHWEHLPIAMYPDTPYDMGGVYSGSAIIEDSRMYLIYTANENHPGENPDHNNRQALAYSDDGISFTKYPNNPVIVGERYQPNFRDPKGWKHRDTYYIVLGNSVNETRGRALLFKSKDLISWEPVSVLAESDGSLGYMWECPDFFCFPNNLCVLLFSPQGIQPQGDRFKNLYQLGYLVGHFDYETHLFTVTSEFRELDFGHDIYASQTLEDRSGRRIVIAWNDMWENVYPERDDGWTGQMTIPRVLTLTKDQRLLQKPIREVLKLRENLLYSGEGNGKTSVKIPNNAGEIEITAPRLKDFEFILESGGNTTVTITYNYKHGTIALDRGGNDGLRRTSYRPLSKLKLRVFIDRSSIEIFSCDGKITFTSRIFPQGQVYVKLGADSIADHITAYSLKL